MNSRIASFVLMTLFLLPAAARPAQAGVDVAVLPAAQTVTPGSVFDLTIEITQAGSAFNGFEAIVEYDPAALTFLPRSPISLQQGCLMTGACSAACGNTFHQFQAAADSLTINDVLLCNAISLTGPGPVYVLRFQASSTVQVSNVRLRRARFYNAGLFVNPVTTHDAQVGIGVILGVEEGTVAGLEVRAEPNPSSGRMRFAIRDELPGVRDVSVMDVQGRTVRHLSTGWAQGESSVLWDGRDDHGAQLAPGVYLVHVRSGERARQMRVVLLQ